eukprot:GFUD01038738.1.p1 GENE.GFUD01038738.1~~GFUD01038738.1.p1  ORF type:complete len:110 (+),score=12.89 GFUD01038738.1:245-574(+)
MIMVNQYISLVRQTVQDAKPSLEICRSKLQPKFPKSSTPAALLTLSGTKSSFLNLFSAMRDICERTMSRDLSIMLGLCRAQNNNRLDESGIFLTFSLIFLNLNLSKASS